MAKFRDKVIGYGQVEPNRLTGIVSGAIEAQAPAVDIASNKMDKPSSTNGLNVLENGRFLCVIPAKVSSSTGAFDFASGFSCSIPMGRIAVLPGDAPATAVPYLVFNERKQYDEKDVYSDFAVKAEDCDEGVIYPRLVAVMPDVDVITTNTIADETSTNLDANGNLKVGTVLYIGNDGYLSETEGTNKTYQFVVTKAYTMPDGQNGVKLQCQKYVDTTPGL